MPRSIWRGAISFGLVNVPVKAYTAVRDHDVHFHQLDKRSGSRIRYEKVAEKSGKEVESDDIEMGFEIRKGRYVTFDKKELEELRPESTRAVDVTDFVTLEEIDPIYYERTYWLAPADEPAKRAYNLLLAVMEDGQRVGIGTVVMRNKQYLAAIRPLDGVLAMSTMRFADEVVPRSDIDELPRRRTKPEAKSLRMASQLLDAMSSEWDPRRYHDTFTEELRARIEAKDKGEDIVEEAGPAEDRGTVVDLMAALQESVEASKAGRSRARSSGSRSSRSSGSGSSGSRSSRSRSSSGRRRRRTA
jgi:DNA end-binding protein Ku